jgi:hypothetical protein
MFGSPGAAMRIPAIVAGCIALATLLSGCDANDKAYFREGIGTDLYTTDIAAATDLQNTYLDNLCRQSLSYVGAVPSCSNRGELPTALWPLIVQAGMNDIDTRCDSYLSWLDVKKRENGAVLSEIGAVRVAVDALTNPAITTVSPVALAAVAAAFGLATSTLGNVNSLLLQVDHTTVQNIVFTQRQAFRVSLLGLTSELNNKPTAIHALRTYLTICMPMTISAGINSTVTVFQQTGTFGRTLTPTTTIGSPFTPASPTQKPPRSTFIPADPDVAPFFSEKNLSQAETEFTLRGLCIDKNKGTGLTRANLIKALVAIFEATPDSDNPLKPDHIISGNERRTINLQPNCGSAMNYFEKATFANTLSSQATKNSADDLAILISGLLKRSPGGDLSGPDPLANPTLRGKISTVRAALGVNDVPPSLNTQATPALFNLVKK